MPREDIQIDQAPIVETTSGILSPSMLEALEPYIDFVNHLHAQGRITEEELDALHLQLSGLMA